MVIGSRKAISEWAAHRLNDPHCSRCLLYRRWACRVGAVPRHGGISGSQSFSTASLLAAISRYPSYSRWGRPVDGLGTRKQRAPKRRLRHKSAA